MAIFDTDFNVQNTSFSEHLFIPESGISPAKSGSPTLAEVGTFALTNLKKNVVAYYNGTDVDSKENLKYLYVIDHNYKALIIENYTDMVGYVPTILPGSLSMGTKAVNTTFTQKFYGTFMDGLDEFSISSNDDSGVSISLVSKNSKEIALSITTNTQVQSYTITLKGLEQTFTATFETEVFTSIVPSLNGSGSNLWVKENVANNDVILTDGGYQAENNTGDGWNDRSSFGTVSSTQKLILEFDILELQDASNAYCHIRMNTSNVGSTTGGPRVYVQNGNTMVMFNNNNGGMGSVPIEEGDNISMEITPTNYKVFRNGTEVGTHTGTYNISDIYSTFTAYRVFKIENINLKVY